MKITIESLNQSNYLNPVENTFLFYILNKADQVNLAKCILIMSNIQVKLQDPVVYKEYDIFSTNCFFLIETSEEFDYETKDIKEDDI